MAGKKAYAAVFLAVFLGNLASYTAWGAEVSADEQERIRQKQAELEGVQGQIGGKRQAVDATREKARTAYEELRVVERELAYAEGELQDLQGGLGKLENKIEANEQFLEAAVGRLAKRRETYNKRVRNIYMHGQVNYLDILLGARDFVDFTTRFQLLTRIIKNDVALINEITKDQAMVKQQQEELAQAQEDMRQMRDAASSKQQAIAGHRQQRRVAFDAASEERKQAEREYNELLAISERITDIIRRIEAHGQPIGKGTGTMIWPLRGQITSPYGWRTHPIFGSRRFHAGIDIGGAYGDTVVAADEGVVISSGWMGGYGYTIMLDHGAGIMTLYAHNSELLVSVGEKVVKGQSIAYVGATGYATGPHCHFEVRLHGETAAPLSYLP